MRTTMHQRLVLHLETKISVLMAPSESCGQQYRAYAKYTR